MKPISTVPKALDTIDVATGEPAKVNQVSHSKQPTGKCGYCGYDLPHRTQNGECPAKGKICSKCEKPNHFSKVCRSTNNNGRDSIGNGSGGNGFSWSGSGGGRRRRTTFARSAYFFARFCAILSDFGTFFV